jgi:hypothetical protein
MTASAYTDVFARFTDLVAAETLAEFIAAWGIPCHLEELSGSNCFPFARCYGVRVARGLIEELKQRLQLTPVGAYRDSLSANVVAGRLARERIPSYVGDQSVTGVGPYGIGISGVPIDDDGRLGGSLAVPAAYVDAAKRVLSDVISDDELTKLALTESDTQTS